MSLGAASKEIAEAGIVQINRELKELGSEARSLGLEPVKPEELPVPEEKYTQISPTTTPAGFWSHHIGGPVYAVDAQMYLQELTGTLDEEIVRSIQGRAHILTRNWVNHPQGKGDLLNMQSCEAFLEGGFAFDWLKRPPLTRKLKDQIADLSELYTVREGHTPIGFLAIMQGRSAPTRAYLMCFPQKNSFAQG